MRQERFFKTFPSQLSIMNPKKLAAISAVSIILFIFLLIATLFALIGCGLFAILGDAVVSKVFFYGTVSTGFLSAIAIVVAVVANTILVTYKI